MRTTLGGIVLTAALLTPKISTALMGDEGIINPTARGTCQYQGLTLELQCSVNQDYCKLLKTTDASGRIVAFPKNINYPLANWSTDGKVLEGYDPADNEKEPKSKYLCC